MFAVAIDHLGMVVERGQSVFTLHDNINLKFLEAKDLFLAAATRNLVLHVVSILG